MQREERIMRGPPMKLVGRAVAATARKRRVRSFMVDFGGIRT